MLRIKLNLTLLAVVLGLGSAFAFRAPAASKTLQLYSYNAALGQWNQTPIDPNQEGQPGGWQCTTESNVCTAYFSSKPSIHQAPPAGYEVGVFSTIP